MKIDNELQTLEILDQSIRDYAQSLKSLADLLCKLDSPVSERNLVMYMLNGLNEKFDNIINVIKHQKTFPLFDDVKSMLQDEEQRLKKTNTCSLSLPYRSCFLILSVDCLCTTSSFCAAAKIQQPETTHEFKQEKRP